MKDFSIALLLVCAAVFFIGWADYATDKAECNAYGELTGYEVKLLRGSRCVVNHPDMGWISAWGEKR